MKFKRLRDGKVFEWNEGDSLGVYQTLNGSGFEKIKEVQEIKKIKAEEIKTEEIITEEVIEEIKKEPVKKTTNKRGKK